MYKNLILLMAVMAVFVSSCKKDDTKKCKTGATLTGFIDMSHEDPLPLNIYEIDDCGKVKSFCLGIYSANPTVTILSRDLSGNVLAATWMATARDTMVMTLTYDDKKQVKSKEVYGNGGLRHRNRYEYDALGRLTVEKVTERVFSPFDVNKIEKDLYTLRYTYVDNRKCPEVIERQGDIYTYRVKYTYDDHRSPTFDIDPQAYYLGISHYAESNVLTATLGGEVTYYNYTYRTDGFIDRYEMSRNSNPSSVWEYKYTYNK